MGLLLNLPCIKRGPACLHNLTAHLVFDAQVPIVEPEILLDGDHDIDRTLEVSWVEARRSGRVAVSDEPLGRLPRTPPLPALPSFLRVLAGG